MRGNTPTLMQRLRRGRGFESLAVAGAAGLVRVLAALPSRWIAPLADGVGTALAFLNLRARRIGYQNLESVFGPDLSRRTRRRIFRAAYCNTVRSVLLLGHVQPLTPERYRTWVDVEPGLAEQPRLRRLVTGGGVLVSGHLGNWEFLLGLRVLFPELPRAVFLAEAIPHQAINELLVRLRSHTDLVGVLRRGGARAVARIVGEGGMAGLLVDTNVRGMFGGIYVPFLGQEARTTPLPAWVARRYGVPVHAIFCLPTPDGRYRIEVGDDLTEGLDATDEAGFDHALMGRVNDVLGEVIREHPELWQWALKRFKSRPQAQRDRYPAYSEHDPDRDAPAPA